MGSVGGLDLRKSMTNPLVLCCVHLTLLTEGLDYVPVLPLLSIPHTHHNGRVVRIFLDVKSDV